MARYSDNAPYQLSRAALREKYGARAITSGGQSSLDTTPSGRAKYLEETQRTPKGQPISENEARAMVKQEFQKNFKEPIAAPNPAPPVAPPQLLTRETRKQPFAGGVASPEDVGMVRSQGGTGTLRVGTPEKPYGTVTLGLLPETVPPDQMAPFIPTTVSPLSNFSLPQRKPNSLLTPQSPWRRSMFG